MRYSRKKISNTGNIVLTSKDEAEIEKAYSLINEWRTDHLAPLEELKEYITGLLKKFRIIPKLISQRLKRIKSIENKLDYNPSMGLGGMQDIGGLRIVVDDMNTLYALTSFLSQDIGSFKYKRSTDYIVNPKESGYRSIHFIYTLSSEDKILNGLNFELQIRTNLQHSWATALETVDIHTNSPLKSGYGDEEWLDFFRLVSSLFAFKEKSPRMNLHSELTVEELMQKYYKFNAEKGFLNLLKAFEVVLKDNSKKSDSKTIDYYLLLINLKKNIVSIISYKKEDYETATSDYFKFEKSLSVEDAVVLVATSSYEELLEAYPSYFSDIQQFILSLEKVEENCELLGLI